MMFQSDDSWSWPASPHKEVNEMSIQICRICLATDGLTPVDPALWRALTEVTGVLWLDERLPSDLCVQCKALVTKYQKFLARAQRVNDTLLQLMSRDSLNITTINRIKGRQLGIKPLLEPRHYPPNHCNLYHDACNVGNDGKNIIIEISAVETGNKLKTPKTERVEDEESIDMIYQNDPHSFKVEVTTSDFAEQLNEITNIAHKYPVFTNSGSITHGLQENIPGQFKTEEKKLLNSIKSEKHDSFDRDVSHNDGELSSSFIDVQVANYSHNTNSGRINYQTGEWLPGPFKREASSPKKTVKFGEEEQNMKQKNKALLKNKHKKTQSITKCAPSTSTVDKTSKLKSTEVNGMSKEGLKPRPRPTEKKHMCNYCDYRCLYLSNLNLHIRTQHTSDKPYECNLCDYKAGAASYLKSHYLTHRTTGEKCYICDFCGFKCFRRPVFVKHIRFTHFGERPFACNICNHTFSLKNILLTHLRTHTGEKPYACHICNYVAAQKSRLKIHVRTHTGEKPFECNLCDYRTAQKRGLKAHLQTHSGEKPFPCEYCDHKFSTKQLLINHTRTHTGEKPYSCKFCDYKCSNSANLSKHLKTHTGDKPYACNVCDRKFSRCNVMKEHIRKAHTTLP